MKKRKPIDDGIIQALYHDGTQSVDDLVNDSIAAEQAKEMMDAAIEQARMKVSRRRERRAVLSRGVGVAALLLVAFLAFAPPGRVLADGFAKSFVRMLIDQVMIREVSKTEDIGLQTALPYGEYEYTSIEELSKVLGHSLVGLQKTDGVSTQVELVSQQEMDNVITTYALESGDSLVVMQTIFADGSNMGTSAWMPDGATVIKGALFNGTDAYLYQNTDGVGAVAVWNNMRLSITSQTIPIQELSSYLDKFVDIK